MKQQRGDIEDPEGETTAYAARSRRVATCLLIGDGAFVEVVVLKARDACLHKPDPHLLKAAIAVVVVVVTASSLPHSECDCLLLGVALQLFDRHLLHRCPLAGAAAHLRRQLLDQLSLPHVCADFCA